MGHKGAHRHREYGPREWLQLVAQVLGMSPQRLALSMDAACKHTRMLIQETGRSAEREKGILPVFSKSSSKVRYFPSALPAQDLATSGCAKIQT